MRILHFADLHLGVETYGKTDLSTGLNTRFIDFLDSFDRLTDYAIENTVDVVLFCGDAYKSRDPSQTQQREFARRIKKMAEAGIEVFLLVGNHDLPNAYGRATTADIFETLRVSHVTVADVPEVYRLKTASGPLQIVALPWLKRSNVLSKDERKNMPLDEIKSRMQEALTATITRYAVRVDPSIPAVLAGHVWVEGAGLGTENNLTIGREHVLLPSVVANSAFDYVALGHIHRHQVLRQQNPPVIYAGSLDSLDFGDEGLTKGFYIVDIDIDTGCRKVSHRFHAIQGRRFITIKAEISDQDLFPTEKILNLLDERGDDISGNIIRLEIVLPVEAVSGLRESDIRRAATAAYYFAIIKSIRRETRPQSTGLAGESATPLEVFKNYLKANPDAYTATRSEILVTYGEDIIRSNQR